MPVSLVNNMKYRSLLISACLLLLHSGCMPMSYPPGATITTAQIEARAFLTADGARLPLRHWLPHNEPQAIIIALHGFNDYSHFFAAPADYFSKQGIACFAYDQRGFGEAPQRGLWAGGETYAQDLKDFTRLIKQRYPKQPVYLLGESMGGAIVITAQQQSDMPEVGGIILAAPALWARSTMPWYQTSLLWALAHSLPWLALTGSSMEVLASDNLDMLRAMNRDPLVIKATRIDTVYGLTDLMDAAFAGAESLRTPTLLLYGEKDEVIPKEPTYAFLQQMLATQTTDKTVAIYPNGYHMLLRDLQATTTWADIAAWIQANPKQLPSGADNRARQILGRG